MADVMNKKVMAEVIANDFDLSKKAASEIVDSVFNSIANSLKEGNTVDIAGFGKFIVKERAARTGINPKTMEKITIAASKAPGFKPGKALKDVVK